MRPTSLRSRLTLVLVGLGLSSVAVLAVVNYLLVRHTLDQRTEAQLATLVDERRQAIEGGIDQLKATVAVFAAEPGVTDALVELADAFDRLDEDITSEQMQELERQHDEDVLSVYDAAGVDRPSAEAFVPGSAAGRYLQYHYLVAPTGPAEERRGTVDAGDGSEYSEIHARHHPFLDELLSGSVGADLALVSFPNADVVYSVAKRMDLGTNLVDGPFRETGLGEAALERLARVPVGEAVIVDSEFFLPATSSPTVFVAAAVRSDTEVIGAVVVQVPIEVLTVLTTAGGQWSDLGLGDTGETYVVGPDRLLRSNSRLWLEDPDEYLRRLDRQSGDERIGELIRFVGSPVLLQSVENDAVEAAFGGESFSGRVDNYLGTASVTAATRLDTLGLDWVVVAERAVDEAGEPLDTFVRRILVVLAIVLPIVALVGVLVARTVTRAATPVVDAARRIADGQVDDVGPDLGRNEFGDLARQLQAVSLDLRERERAVLDEEQRIIEMLSAVLPQRLVDRVRCGERSITDVVDTATVISLTLTGFPQSCGAVLDVLLELTARIAGELDELADRHSVERVDTSSDHPIFVAGLGRASFGADDAAAFALEAVGAIGAIGEEFDVGVRAQCGLSAGDVATGVLGTTQVSFEVWGQPPGIAAMLSTVAPAGDVLLDDSVSDRLADHWELTVVEGLAAVRDQGVEIFRLEPVDTTTDSDRDSVMS